MEMSVAAERVLEAVDETTATMITAVSTLVWIPSVSGKTPRTPPNITWRP